MEELFSVEKPDEPDLTGVGLKFPRGSKVLDGRPELFEFPARLPADPVGSKVDDGRSLVPVFDLASFSVRPFLEDVPGFPAMKLLDGLSLDGEADDFFLLSSLDEKLKLPGGPDFFFESSVLEEERPVSRVGSNVLLGRSFFFEAFFSLPFVFFPMPFVVAEGLADVFLFFVPPDDLDGLNPLELGGVKPPPPDLLVSPKEKLGGGAVLFLFLVENEFPEDLGCCLLLLFFELALNFEISNLFLVSCVKEAG